MNAIDIIVNPKKKRGRKPKFTIETNKKDKLFNSYALAIKPEQNLPIVEWAAKYVKLARSNRSEYADLTQTPWLIQPIETILGNNASEIVINSPTGSGKSTMLEIIGTYIVAEKPGPTLFACQTDPDAQEWFQTGLLPALESCKLIDNLWPVKMNLKRKDFIQFTHMPLWCGGSNMSNFQSKSVDYVFIDEAWMLKKSLLEEAKKRTHDRFNSKVVLVSQAGVIGDDLDISFNQCYKFEFCYKCPSCNEYHPYNFEQLKWSCDKADDVTIWESLQVWYECTCGHKFEDTVNERRMMACTGKYIPAAASNPLPGHYGFHFTALNIWWVPWNKLVVEFLKANDWKKKGNFHYLKQFLQKRLAKPWDEYELIESVELNFSEYTLADKAKYDVTILTADVQKQDIWYVVRTWSKSGESRLLEANKVVSFADLAKVQEAWEIKHNAVFLDSAYRTEEVKAVLARYKWLGLNGRPDDNYTIKNRVTGKTYRRLYGYPNQHHTQDGVAVITYYSSNGAKDILFILKAGHGAKWEIPKDISEDYRQQINSEIKIIGNNNKPMYKKIKVNNHFLDVEAMSVMAASMHGCFPAIIPQDTE